MSQGSRPEQAVRTETVTAMATATKQIPKEHMVVGNVGGATALNHFVAERTMRRLRQLGYDIEMSLMETAAGLAALVSGSSPMIYAPFLEVAPAIRDKPGSIFAISQVVHGSYPLWLILAKKGVKFEDFPGNPNLRFDVSRMGVSSQIIPADAYQKLGLDPKTVNWVEVGGTGARLAALQSGQIQAGLVYTDLAMITVAGNPNTLDIIGPPQTVDSWRFVANDFAQNSPEIVKAVIRANNWVIYYLREETRTVLSRRSNMD
jgi:ABC-type nitrate/sulfonate/bicarbonate transport system substrate-binding protein